jgi:hypothetical protein
MKEQDYHTGAMAGIGKTSMKSLGVPLAPLPDEIEINLPEEDEPAAAPLSLYWQLADRELKARSRTPVRRTRASVWVGKRVAHVQAGCCFVTNRMSLVIVFDDESVAVTDTTCVENTPRPEDWARVYRQCRSCHRIVAPGLERFAVTNHQQVLCGDPACVAHDMVERYGCCDKAELRQCNCLVSTVCPDHGIRCHGTHD